MIELIKSVCNVYYKDENLLKACTKMVGRIIHEIYQNDLQENANQLTIILKSFQKLELQVPGTVFNTDNMSGEVMKLL